MFLALDAVQRKKHEIVLFFGIYPTAGGSYQKDFVVTKRKFKNQLLESNETS